MNLNQRYGGTFLDGLANVENSKTFLPTALFKSAVHGSNLVYEERQFLHGRQLRVSAFSVAYFLFNNILSCIYWNYSYSGICNDVVTWLAEHFQMELVYVLASDSDRDQVGLVQAIVKQLVTEEVDITPFTFVITAALSLVVDFTITLAVEDYYLLQLWPKEESNVNACIRPFSATVWLLFVISTIALVICMAILTHSYRKHVLKSRSFMQAISDHAIYAITVITGQGNYVSPKEKFSFRLLLGIWCLTMVVLVNAYTTILTSYLTAPKLNPIVNTLAELAANPDIQMTVDYELGKADGFLAATSGLNKIIGDSLRAHPKFLVNSSNLAGVNYVLQEGAFYFANGFLSQYFMAIDMKSHSKCRMTMSDALHFTEYYNFALPKRGRHNWIINHDLQYLWDNGLLSYWIKQYKPNVDKCLVAKAEVGKQRGALKLLDLSSAFVLLGIGIGLSFFVFLLEMVTRLKEKQKIHRVTEITVF